MTTPTLPPLPDRSEFTSLWEYTEGQMQAYALAAYAAGRDAAISDQLKPDNIKRAEFYGEGYRDGWNAALEEAAQCCTNTSMMNVDSYCGSTAHMCADRIRALKPAKGGV